MSNPAANPEKGPNPLSSGWEPSQDAEGQLYDSIYEEFNPDPDYIISCRGLILFHKELKKPENPGSSTSYPSENH